MSEVTLKDISRQKAKILFIRANMKAFKDANLQSATAREKWYKLIDDEQWAVNQLLKMVMEYDKI